MENLGNWKLDLWCRADDARALYFNVFNHSGFRPTPHAYSALSLKSGHGVRGGGQPEVRSRRSKAKKRRISGASTHTYHPSIHPSVHPSIRPSVRPSVHS